MGKEMFSKPFKNGKSYEDCFPNKGIGIRQNYPYFDEKEGKVVTLELALNRCREANGEPPFSYVKDEMAALTAYMAFTSRGKPMDIKIPERSARARGLRERQGIFLHAARPAQFLLRHLPCAEPGRAHPRRSAGARARHPERDADLPFGMERHGHHQPALHHLQQPDPRRAARARRTTNIATSNTICPMSATGCRFLVRERGHEEHGLKSALVLALLAGARRPRSPPAPRTTSRRPTPRPKAPTRKPAACATSGPPRRRRWRRRRRRPTPATSTRPPHRPRKPKRWRKLRSSRPPARRPAGRIWKYARA